MKTLDLLMDDGENGAGRLAALELGGQWMCKKIAFCVLLIRLEGIIKNQLKICGRGGHRVRVGHGGMKRTCLVCTTQFRRDGRSSAQEKGKRTEGGSIVDRLEWPNPSFPS